MFRRGEERRQERETFGRGGNATRYQMRRKMLSMVVVIDELTHPGR